MVVLVTGSRGYRNLESVWTVLDQTLASLEGEPLTIIAGGAKGPDTAAVKWAKERGCDYEVYGAIWEHGPYMGFVRNSFMCELLLQRQRWGEKVVMIAFWDEVSHGTRQAVDYARRCGLPVEVWRCARVAQTAAG